MFDTIKEVGGNFLASKGSTVFFAFAAGILFYFYYNTQSIIEEQKQEISNLNTLLGQTKSKVESERLRCNNEIDLEVLRKNNSILKQEKEQLENAKNNLLKYSQQKEEEVNNINKELNNIKNKECLNKIVDNETVESLNKIFNGDNDVF